MTFDVMQLVVWDGSENGEGFLISRKKKQVVIRVREKSKVKKVECREEDTRKTKQRREEDRRKE